MNTLEDFLLPTQEGLFKLLRKRFEENAVHEKGSFLLVPGESPVLLIAHLDTVHRNPVKTICQSEGGTILMSPQGIGGDDRCGVYGICKVYEAAEQKPWLLFTCDEEIGGKGADAFCVSYLNDSLPSGLGNLKIIVELDRKGKNDAVYYYCGNPEFEEYIKTKGFRKAFGSFSDISIIAPILGVAAVNLSCGYYNAHTPHEYVNRHHLKATVRKVVEIVSDAGKPDFPKYEYVDTYGGYSYWDDVYGDWFGYGGDIGYSDAKIPKDLPPEFKGIYEELLDVYEPEELLYCLKNYGVQSLRELYEYQYGAG